MGAEEREQQDQDQHGPRSHAFLAGAGDLREVDEREWECAAVLDPDRTDGRRREGGLRYHYHGRLYMELGVSEWEAN